MTNASGKTFKDVYSDAKKAMNGIDEETKSSAQNSINNAKKGSSGASNAIKKGSNSAVKSIKDITRTLKGIVGYYAVIKGIKWFKGLIDGASKAKKEFRKLEQSMKSSGTFTKQAFDENKKFALLLQFQTGRTVEEITEVMTILQTFGRMNQDTLKKSTVAVLDLATAMGSRHLRGTAVQVGKAFVGIESTLTRVGVSFNKAKIATDGFNEVLRELDVEFGGQAQAAFQGYEKSSKNVAASLREFSKAVGGLFTNNLKFNKLLSDITDTLLKWTNSVIDGKAAYKGYVDEFTSFIEAFASAASYLKKSELLPFIKKQVTGIVEYFGKAADAGTTYFEDQNLAQQRSIKEGIAWLRRWGKAVRAQADKSNSFSKLNKAKAIQAQAEYLDKLFKQQVEHNAELDKSQLISSHALIGLIDKYHQDKKTVDYLNNQKHLQAAKDYNQQLLGDLKRVIQDQISVSDGGNTKLFQLLQDRFEETTKKYNELTMSEKDKLEKYFNDSKTIVNKALRDIKSEYEGQVNDITGVFRKLYNERLRSHKENINKIRILTEQGNITEAEALKKTEAIKAKIFIEEAKKYDQRLERETNIRLKLKQEAADLLEANAKLNAKKLADADAKANEEALEEARKASNKKLAEDTKLTKKEAQAQRAKLAEKLKAIKVEQQAQASNSKSQNKWKLNELKEEEKHTKDLNKAHEDRLAQTRTYLQDILKLDEDFAKEKNAIKKQQLQDELALEEQNLQTARDLTKRFREADIAANRALLADEETNWADKEEIIDNSIANIDTALDNLSRKQRAGGALTAQDIAGAVAVLDDEKKKYEGLGEASDEVNESIRTGMALIREYASNLNLVKDSKIAVTDVKQRIKEQEGVWKEYKQMIEKQLSNVKVSIDQNHLLKQIQEVLKAASSNSGAKTKFTGGDGGGTIS